MKVPEYKWLHVASEGDFSGHVDGEFQLDRDVFESFIDNFRADPRYRPDANGTGSVAVLPFDYEHASELAATEGSIPGSGAPAPAWVLELDVRDGDDGKAQLWAYAKLGERIRSYIENDEYRHVSIAFSLDAIDPVTGAPVGPRMSSIAFTNHPFLRGLTPIAARKTKAQIAARRSQPSVLFAARSVALSDAVETLGEKPPRDLSATPIAFDAEDVLEQVVAYLQGDADFDVMSEEEQLAYAQECIDFTNEKANERNTPSGEQTPNERTGHLNRANPLNLTDSEIDICIAAPNPTMAAYQVLCSRDPDGIGKHALRTLHPQVRELAGQLAGWEESVRAGKAPSPDGSELEPEAPRRVDRGRGPIASPQLRAAYRNALGPNPHARMESALLSDPTLVPGVAQLERSRRLRLCTQLLQQIGE